MDGRPRQVAGPSVRLVTAASGQVDRCRPEALNVSERRKPRPAMRLTRTYSSGSLPLLARPGFGPRRISARQSTRHRTCSGAPSPRPPERHIDAQEPGEIVQMDCFFIGLLMLGSSGPLGCHPSACTPYSTGRTGLRGSVRIQASPPQMGGPKIYFKSTTFVRPFCAHG